MMYGCQVGLDGLPSGGHYQYAYDGRDFLAFDKETRTWTALTPPAQVTKWNWESEKSIAERWKAYLEEICVEWLQRYLNYGHEALLRAEAPAVKVAQKAGYDGRETLICRVARFPHPKGNGAGPTAPGSCGVDSQERDRYRCQVAHDSLPEPQDFTWVEPASNLALILGILGAVLAALILLGAMVIIYRKKYRHAEAGYKPTAGE
uniref:Uncharacterized protein n=1 Tax=Sphaerodactylus townsendi TaxID=933632 RepID=A0ACB8EFM4_9SAUR